MVVGGSRQETLNLSFVLLGTRQQSVSVILKELLLPDGLDLVSPSFTFSGVVAIKIFWKLLSDRRIEKICEKFVWIEYSIQLPITHQPLEREI
ncbi:unnamed protein product [Schistosoma margrebowiei]|uniref:Uncharacterized protein n=1 Tax=Schistosoma margrebowiei TaxID=48269 RepID=A0A183MV59_9TREM|nr:unnamed protein product [Schistosoma margrebowiei]